MYIFNRPGKFASTKLFLRSFVKMSTSYWNVFTKQVTEQETHGP